MDFDPTEGDVLRIPLASDILDRLVGNSLQDSINDYIDLALNNGSTEVRVNPLGTDLNPFGFQKIAVLDNVVLSDAGALYASGNIQFIVAL